MKSNMWKSTFREIKQSFGRFMAIFAIIALGVSMFAGLKAARPAMVKTVNDYMTEKQFYDYRLLSTLGFEKEDVEFLASKNDVRAAEGVVSFDILCSRSGGSDIVLKAFNLPENINGIELTAGKMPENASECIADSGYFTENDIGKKLKLSEANSEEDLGHFKEREFTITGIAQSSAYIQYERGNTSLGNGQIRGFLYLPMESFDTDYFTEILVKFDQDFEIYSEAYDSYMSKKEAEWEAYAEEAAQNRYDRIVTEAQEKLGNAKKELADAQQEFLDGKEKGEKELAGAKKELTDAKRELTDGDKKVADAKKEIADGKKTLEENREELQNAEDEITSNEQKLLDGALELNKNKSALLEKKAELLDGKRQLADGEEELAQQKTQVEKAVAGMSELKTQIPVLNGSLSALEYALQYPLTPELEETLGGAVGELESGVGQIYEALNLGGFGSGNGQTLSERAARLRSAMTEIEGEIPKQEEALAEAQKQIADAEAQIAEKKAVLNAADTELAKAEIQIEQAQVEIDSGKERLEYGKKELEKGRKEFEIGEKKLLDGEKELIDKEKELEDGWKEYKKGLTEYEDGVRKFHEETADAEEKIADGKEKIADAERELADLKQPESYLLDRNKNVGYVCFENDSTIVDGIANVFPVFFFAVAALVCITTMTRMIEEQRTQIGVLKALGYSEGSIMGKYLFYSGTAALTGCLAGFFGGSWIFPNVIWNAYGIMYDVGGMASMLDWTIGFISLIVSLGCSMGTTYLTCRKELHEVAAELMRPKAPKAGKRVLLERVPFVWRRLKFLHKVSYRNVFRYKRRFLMMVIGISGCTGLMLTGFGVRDSVTTLADDQYGMIQVFDMSVVTADGITDDTVAEIKKTAGKNIKEMLCLMEKTVDFVSGDSEKSLNLVAVDEKRDISPYVHLEDKNGNPLPYPDNGECLIGDKIAELYGVQAGDVITLQDDDHHTMKLTVSGIFRNYIMNYVYMTTQTYESASGNAAVEKTVYMNTEKETDVHQLSANLMKLDQVAAVTATADTRTRFAGMMDSMDLIVGIIILCAAGLAFIVLYNLTNINITERVREIATIKVLGFYRNETASYIFRENLILTLIGALAGLGLGKLFHMFVISQIKLDQINFETRILPLSYIYSVLLTFAFAFFINLVMQRKLDQVSMTESLKSVD